MLDPQERIKEFTKHCNVVEEAATNKAQKEAIRMMELGYNLRFISNKTMLGMKWVEQTAKSYGYQ